MAKAVGNRFKIPERAAWNKLKVHDKFFFLKACVKQLLPSTDPINDNQRAVCFALINKVEDAMNLPSDGWGDRLV